ncbi:hypothetical protein TcasGA2_TC031031 [Tribolium castaneum]|uniref:Uncharacterized protein n=1 Tax=Tribolium castaneum TaxID=7070 RepID=A0A139WKU7_TRICA|nr:hypothetical protein TcasGA2_TC031031 [Tribolium castaneum]
MPERKPILNVFKCEVCYFSFSYANNGDKIMECYAVTIRKTKM